MVTGVVHLAILVLSRATPDVYTAFSRSFSLGPQQMTGYEAMERHAREAFPHLTRWPISTFSTFSLSL